MKGNTSRFIKLRRVLFMSLAFKILLSGLLFMVWLELQTQKHNLTPAQQAIFESLQKNITALHDQFSLHKNHTASSVATDASLSIEKLQALKATQAVMKQLAAGEKLNLLQVKPFLSGDSLQQLSNLQTTHISNASLQEELYHCFNDVYSPKKQNSSLDNFVKIEESSIYNEKLLTHNAFSQAQNAISETNYDSALKALEQFPKDLQDATCIQKIIFILEGRATITKLLISTQKDLLKDE